MTNKLFATILILLAACFLLALTPPPPAPLCETETPTPEQPTETEVVQPTATLPVTVDRTKPAIVTLPPPHREEEEEHISPETGAPARPMWWPEILALVILAWIIWTIRKGTR